MYQHEANPSLEAYVWFGDVFPQFFYFNEIMNHRTENIKPVQDILSSLSSVGVLEGYFSLQHLITCDLEQAFASEVEVGPPMFF